MIPHHGHRTHGHIFYSFWYGIKRNEFPVCICRLLIGLCQHITAAVISSAGRNLEELIAVVFAGLQGNAEQKKISRAISARLLPLAAAFKKPRAVARVLEEITRKPGGGKSYEAWQFDALAGLAESSAKEGGPFRKEIEKTRGPIKEMTEAAAGVLGDASLPVRLRGAAIRLAGQGPTLGRVSGGTLRGLARLLERGVVVSTTLPRVEPAGFSRDGFHASIEGYAYYANHLMDYVLPDRRQTESTAA